MCRTSGRAGLGSRAGGAAAHTRAYRHTIKEPTPAHTHPAAQGFRCLLCWGGGVCTTSGANPRGLLPPASSMASRSDGLPPPVAPPPLPLVSSLGNQRRRSCSRKDLRLRLKRAASLQKRTNGLGPTCLVFCFCLCVCAASGRCPVTHDQKSPPLGDQTCSLVHASHGLFCKKSLVGMIEWKRRFGPFPARSLACLSVCLSVCRAKQNASLCQLLTSR